MSSPALSLSEAPASRDRRARGRHSLVQAGNAEALLGGRGGQGRGGVAPSVRDGCGGDSGRRLTLPEDGVNEGGRGQGRLHHGGRSARAGILCPGALWRAWGFLLDANQGAAGQGPAHGAQASASASAGPTRSCLRGRRWAAPLVYTPARRGHRAAGGQFGDVGDDGSGAGDSVWRVEAGAAVGWRGGLPPKGGEHAWWELRPRPRPGRPQLTG